MSYKVPQHIDPNKVFIVNFSELEGRLEPDFYRPSIASLEKNIRSLSSHKLRDYALSIAGGATPPKTEAEKYYTDPESGIPFLRVQNLRTNGELSLNDCVYINEDTHNGLLKRSQVAEGDLLVKITGVGRMAVASVAPNGFVGNTNQHMVVIKTGNASVSRYLARYLNLNIIERIASRHSTGGTRPALDYPSLKSLPIIEGIDFRPIDKAIYIQKQKEGEAQKLLKSINYYLSEELGVSVSEIRNKLRDRILFINRRELVGRLDPQQFHSERMEMIEQIKKRKWCRLKDVVIDVKTTKSSISQSDIYIGLENIESETGEYVPSIEKLSISSAAKFKKGDILFPKLRPYLNKVYRTQFAGCCSTEFHVFEAHDIHPDFLTIVLRSNMTLAQTKHLMTGNTLPRLQTMDVDNLIIPYPDIEMQKKIVEHVSNIRTKAKQLQEEGKALLEEAKQDVEKMIMSN